MFEIIRVEKNNNYTVICNHHLKDKRLSLKAKGLMTIILSFKEDEWDFSIKGLAKYCNEGENAIRTALKELENAGYYFKKAEKINGKIIGWIHTIYENPDVENPDVENPDVENPDVENPAQINTKENNFNNLLSSVNSNFIYKNNINNKLNNNKSNKKTNMLSYQECCKLIEQRVFKVELEEVVKNWVLYKHERKENYTEMGFKSLLTKIENESKALGFKSVIDVINLSMSNTWKGICWEKARSGTTGSIFNGAYVDPTSQEGRILRA